MALATLEDLSKSLKEDCSDSPSVPTNLEEEEHDGETALTKADLVIVTEGGNNFSLPDLVKFRRRPFACRWFITAININWQAVWLRTHFSDNTEMTTPTRRIRDLAKASITDKVKSVVAKAVLADVLTSWFEMDSSTYSSMASMVGSVLSNWGEGVTFETRGTQQDNERPVNRLFMIKSQAEQELSRLRFTRLLNILFNKISIEDFLVKNEKANIFRLTYCLAHTGAGQPLHKRDSTFLTAIMASVTASLIQITFAGFIIKENVDQFRGVEGEEDNKIVKQNWMILLAILTLILSSLLSWPEITNAVATRSFYQLTKREGDSFWANVTGWDVLALMDTISNMILPFILTISGFIIILISESFIDAVLNSTALLFIIEIDDLLPGVLDLDSVSIVRNFLIGAAVQELGEVLKLYENANEAIADSVSSRPAPDSAQSSAPTKPLKKESLVKVAENERILLNTKLGIPKIEYADLLLTDSTEKGTDIPDSFTFAPYEIQGDPMDPDVSNSNYVSKNCLLRRIEWRYTYRYPLSRRPRVGLLKVWKLDEKNAVSDGQEYVLLDFIQDDAPESSDTPVLVDPHKMTDDPHHERMKSLAEKYPDPDALKQDRDLRKEVINDVDEMNVIYAVEGVYMITVFEVSETLLKLRICGSKTAKDFEAAMETYSIWNLDAGAAGLISKHA